MSRLQSLSEVSSDLELVFARRPKYAEVFFASYNEVVSLVDPVLFELGRLRSAHLNGSAFDLAMRFGPAFSAGLTEEKVGALADYATSDLFSESERSWIMFVEQFTIQSSGIDDAMCSEVIDNIGEEQFALHTRAQWAAESLQRTCAVLDVQPDPEGSRYLDGFVPAPTTA